MGSSSLISIPRDELQHLSLFLTEEDIISLSQTCLNWHDSLNSNVVWKRFVTEEVRSLESKTQQLNPPLRLDSSLSENLQHVLRKNHLLSNWRNGRLEQYASDHGVNVEFTHFQHYNVKFYKYNYLFVRQPNIIKFLDITRSPVLHHSMLDIDHRILIGDYLVHADGCRVDVYQINIEEKTFPPLYSFSVVEDEVVNEVIPHKRHANQCCRRWEHGGAGNYLVFNKKSLGRCYPVVHIWDIVNACKVGTFISPLSCHYLKFLALEDNCLFFEAEGRYKFISYLKFDIATKMFSKAVIREEDIHVGSCVMFYRDHCIVMSRFNLEGKPTALRVQVFEFNSTAMVKEQVFQAACLSLQHKRVIDGKLVIFFLDCFHVVDALSLDTVVVVSHERFNYVMCQTSVFGSIFLVTLEGNGVVKIWDIERKTSTIIPQKRFSESTVMHICSAIDNRAFVCGKEPLTKFVIFGEKKLFVTHLW